MVVLQERSRILAFKVRGKLHPKCRQRLSVIRLQKDECAHDFSDFSKSVLPADTTA